MEVDFWYQRWQTNQIGFHESKPHGLLLTHFQALALTKGQRVFLPLCGKTLDIHWLLAEGYQVVGVELSALAVEQLFESLNIQPNITTVEGFMLYRAPKDFGFTIDIFVGDFFDLNPTILGEVAAIYDRAALVALPADMREGYTKHLMQLSNTAKQLLICVEYDEAQVNGPPFSINSALLHDYYAKYYQLTHLETSVIEGGLKGRYPASEAVWQLIAHTNND